jgi:hypothetical protein
MLSCIPRCCLAAGESTPPGLPQKRARSAPNRRLAYSRPLCAPLKATTKFKSPHSGSAGAPAPARSSHPRPALRALQPASQCPSQQPAPLRLGSSGLAQPRPACPSPPHLLLLRPLAGGGRRRRHLHRVARRARAAPGGRAAAAPGAARRQLLLHVCAQLRRHLWRGRAAAAVSGDRSGGARGMRVPGQVDTSPCSAAWLRVPAGRCPGPAGPAAPAPDPAAPLLRQQRRRRRRQRQRQRQRQQRQRRQQQRTCATILSYSSCLRRSSSSRASSSRRAFSSGARGGCQPCGSAAHHVTQARRAAGSGWRRQLGQMRAAGQARPGRGLPRRSWLPGARSSRTPPAGARRACCSGRAAQHPGGQRS